MKTRTFLSIILAASALMIFSCSKSDGDDQPEPTPKYPQLIGTWTGTTSQDDTIAVTVAGQGSNLIITAYYFGIYSMPSQSEYMRISGGQVGLTVPFTSDHSFAFQAGTTANDTLNGVFDPGEMILTGSITCQFIGQTGNPVVTATYSATKK